MEVTVGPNTFRTTRRVACIVVEAFVLNPNNLPEVDHIDDIRDHDKASNLQWVTHQETVFNIVNYKTWKYLNSSATTIESVV